MNYLYDLKKESLVSGFRPFHSTETALIKGMSNIFLTADSGKHVTLVLLDLAVAFDTVDHNMFICRLQQCVGISGLVLSWIKSYLSNRTSCFQ